MGWCPQDGACAEHQILLRLRISGWGVLVRILLHHRRGRAATFYVCCHGELAQSLLFPPLRPPVFLLCFHPPACSAGSLVSCGSSTADNYLSAVLCWMCSFFCSFFQGDLGQSANSSKTVSHVLSGSYTYSLLVGDLSYADAAWKQKSADLPCTPTRWDSWGRFIEPLAANMPLMVLPGNHEVEQDGAPPATQEEFVAFQKRFAMPSEASFAHNGMCCQPHF